MSPWAIREKLLEFDGIVESVINNKRTNKMKYDFWMSRWVSPIWKEDAMNKNRKKSDVGPREIALKQLGWAKNLPVEILDIIGELSYIGDEGCGNRFRPHQVSVDMELRDLREEERQLVELELPEYPSDIWKYNSHFMKRVMGVSPDSYVPTLYWNGLNVYRAWIGRISDQSNHIHPAQWPPTSNFRYAGVPDCHRDKLQSINNTVPRKDRTMSDHIKTVKVKRGLKGPLVNLMKKWDYLMGYINTSGPFWRYRDMFGNNTGNWNIRTHHLYRGRVGDDWREDWDMDE